MKNISEQKNAVPNSADFNTNGLRQCIGGISKKIFSSIPAVAMISAFTIGGLLISCQDKNNQSNQNNKTEVMKNNQEQKEGILKAIDLYVESGKKGDGNIAKPAFASTATMSWSENGVLKSVPIQVLFDGFSAAEPMEANYKLTTLDVEGDAAIVRIESQFGPDKYADMFTLVKDGSDWKIISKVYQVKK
ncbi:nuclear transport factor 2 family protein [Chryseobacterium sp. RP-3-3]|uniref:Nuclear transport factor 2 family protein n=1 Tax=Chryseobacterium antibioticum TaxID=2728847 RepID=A0A7Y0AKP3_9FLAO|nr:nuclear transport factor 2 family protein [Chryseobacterium antibioticum]NML69142.1 nuclear transport factor 2 family protein [Chryseobacterium antibioticum]